MAKLSTKTDARPSYQFYPDDWLGDQALKLCSLTSRGLWQDMNCIMFNSPKRGYLLKPNGSKYEAKDLARVTGASEQEVSTCLAELTSNEVCSTTSDGVIYCRRMVRDQAVRDARAEAGRKGGLFRPGSKSEANGEANTKQTPRTPSSSPSPSPSPDSERNSEGDGAKTRDPTPTPLPVRKRTKTPEGARQTAVQMIRAMAAERDVPWPVILERAGGGPPWKPATVTALKAWLKPLPRYTDAELDQRRRSRRAKEAGTSSGPRAGPRQIGFVIGDLCKSEEASP